MRKALPAILLLAVVAGFAVTDVHAICCCSTTAYHAYDSYFECADATQVAAFSWQVSNPIGVNTDSLDIALEGQAGPGRTVMSFDWSYEGIIGCPISPTPKRIAIVVQGNDGKGLIVSLSGADTDLAYRIEAAHPYDMVNQRILPVPCGDGAGAPTVLARTISGGMVSLALHFNPPRIYSDCDPDSVAMHLLPGVCNDNFAPVTAVARIMTRTGPCTTGPVLQLAQWTDTGVAPDASGNAIVTLPLPAAGQCLYVGNTATIDAFETGGVVGFVTVPGITCSDADGDGFTTCQGDCDDGRADVHPGADEVCDDVDNDCDGVVDEDANGADSDFDGVPNACDNCPTIPNANQDPGACIQRIDSITLTFSSPLGRGSGLLSWTTTHEVDIVGFNVVVFDNQGNPSRQNPALIRCEECITGLGHVYTYVIPKHKSGRNVFVEMLRINGSVEQFGPATRE